MGRIKDINDFASDIDNFARMIDDLLTKAREESIQREQDYNKTINHIISREKEHGPAPQELYLRLALAKATDGVLYLDTDSSKKFSKWLN